MQDPSPLPIFNGWISVDVKLQPIYHWEHMEALKLL